MANEPGTPPEPSVGTTEGTPAGSPAGTTPAAPTGGEGRGVGTVPTADGRATAPDAEFSLGVDPSTLPPELKPLWEQTERGMKATFTKRMQELGQYREKVAAYDSFMSDPVGQLQQLASQYGLAITRREAAQAIQQGQGTPNSMEWDGRGDPPSWDAVLNKAKEIARQELMQEFGPVVQNVRSLQAQSVEAKLDSIDPDWRMYESDMRMLLQKHPTLSNDIPRLYHMALPQEVLEQRAMKKAQETLRASASAARVGSATTSRTTQPAPKKVDSFADAVDEAKRKINWKG